MLCPICLQPIQKRTRRHGRRRRIALSCEHAFHARCISEWLCDHRMRCPLCQRPVSLENEAVELLSAYVEHCLKSSHDRAALLNSLGTVMVRRGKRHVLFQGKNVEPHELFAKAQRNDPLFVNAYINLSLIWPDGAPVISLREPATGESVPKSRLETIGCAYLLKRNDAAIVELFLDIFPEDPFLVEGIDSHGQRKSIIVTKPRLEAELYNIRRKK